MHFMSIILGIIGSIYAITLLAAAGMGIAYALSPGFRNAVVS
jgi:uncharacterized membrane protein YeaQ/YmgE (transglycosylase-associated protein family)